MKTRAVLYARVSGDDYDDDEKSKLDAQLAECRKYADKKQYKVLHEFQEDKFSSGADFLSAVLPLNKPPGTYTPTVTKTPLPMASL